VFIDDVAVSAAGSAVGLPVSCDGATCDAACQIPRPDCVESCKAWKATEPSADSGVYTLCEPRLEVYCDMDAAEGGWTLVYQIAGASDMKSTDAVNTEALAATAGAQDSSDIFGAKLSDDAIRRLCAEQYKVLQWQGGGPRDGHSSYCKFDDVAQYGDAQKYNGKHCGEAYSPGGDGYPNQQTDGSWNAGFTTWGIPGGTILQLNEQDDRLGSHPCWGHNGGCSSCGGGDGSGGCHSQVWCKTDDEAVFKSAAAAWRGQRAYKVTTNISTILE
jgi:hypothetical protein